MAGNIQDKPGISCCKEVFQEDEDISKGHMNQTEGVAIGQIWANLTAKTVMDYNSGNKTAILSHTNIKFDEEWDIYIVSKYLLTKYLLITKGKEFFYTGKVWQTPLSSKGRS